MQSYVFATQIFYVFRTAREVGPYDHIKSNVRFSTVNSRLSYRQLHIKNPAGEER